MGTGLGIVIAFPTRIPQRVISMADSLAMMPWFPGDFLKSTRGWSVTATGVYRALLDAQWDMGSLPEDPAALCNLIHATPKEWVDGWGKCECKFPVMDGRRLNDKLEQHRTKAIRLSDKRRAIGKQGGQASAKAKAEPIATPIVEPIGQAIAESIGQATVNHPSPSPSEEKIKRPDAPAVLEILESDYDDPNDYLIWTAGLTALGGSRARSLMAKLKNTHGAELLAAKIGEMLALPKLPDEPRAYLCKVMQKFERKAAY